MVEHHALAVVLPVLAVVVVALGTAGGRDHPGSRITHRHHASLAVRPTDPAGPGRPARRLHRDHLRDPARREGQQPKPRLVRRRHRQRGTLRRRRLLRVLRCGSDVAGEFGYQSEHQLALAAKAIIAKFYGSAARHSYFDGCSQGGHEGLTEAQRFPHDFNGIISGSPASIGTRDGLISDPLSCHFDPHSLQCAAATTGFCLTSAQVTTAPKLYEGPRDTRGDLLYPGWQLPGSEANWAAWIVPVAPGTQSIDQQIAQESLRYVVNPGVDGAATFRDVTFTPAEFGRLTRANDGMYDAIDPDLSAFRAAGGKLILWAGWADPAISPVGTVAYYQAVQKAMGGTTATSAFARLFMLPGVSHCGGGDGPSNFDALTAITQWVTARHAPASLLTSSVSASGTTTATQPVFPYPSIAVNTTGGPVGQAASYTAQPGTQLTPVTWLGSFRSGYETVSGWVNGHWITRPGTN